MEIRKIKWTPKNGMSIEYHVAENGIEVHYTKQSDAVPTLDCQNALQALKPHLLALTELVPYPKSDKDRIDTSSFTITGISLSGYGEDEKVIITGKKVLTSGKAIALNSPLQSLYNTDTYEWSGNLAREVEFLVSEVKLYLGGNHQAQPKQAEFEFSDKVEDILVEEEDDI